jgi:hypothetical protein
MSAATIITDIASRQCSVEGVDLGAERSNLPGAVGPGFRPSGGAMLSLLRLRC